MKFGYYPGCSLKGSAREYDESLRAIAGPLGVELVEVPDWSCCGATAAHNLDHHMALALPARILALAEQAGLYDLLVPCSALLQPAGERPSRARWLTTQTAQGSARDDRDAGTRAR